MKSLFDGRPIVACSTPPDVRSALSIIRVSGFANLEQLGVFFSRSLDDLVPRQMYLSLFLDSKGNPVDQVTFIYLKAPFSFTGENTLEINCHGNPVIIDKILCELIHSGIFRLAKEGEFSYRAMMNGKLSLSQIEGLDILLNSSSQILSSIGLKYLYGELHTQYTHLYDAFLRMKAALELKIDFSEDVGDQESQDLIITSYEEFSHILSDLYSRCIDSVGNMMTPTIALFGEPNAGKSSLFNLLVRHNRAIVSQIEGTTRDYITENIIVDGIQFKIIDTAGLRTAVNDVEAEGIRRSYDLFEKTFFKVLLINPLRPMALSLDYDKYNLVLLTHSDLDGFDESCKSFIFNYQSSTPIWKSSLKTGSIGPVDLKMESGPIEPVTNFTGPIEPNVKGGPIEPDVCLLVKGLSAKSYHSLMKNDPIVLGRHQIAIRLLIDKQKIFRGILHTERDVAIISDHLTEIENIIVELIGIITPDQVLSSIFNNFCIGK